MVECARLESVCTETYRRFKSSPLRQKEKECQKVLFFYLVDIVVDGEELSGEEIGTCRFVRFRYPSPVDCLLGRPRKEANPLLSAKIGKSRFFYSFFVLLNKINTVRTRFVLSLDCFIASWYFHIFSTSCATRYPLNVVAVALVEKFTADRPSKVTRAHD